MPDTRPLDERQKERHTSFNIPELPLQDVREDADGNVRMMFHHRTRFEHVENVGTYAVEDELSIVINRQSAEILYRYLDAMLSGPVTLSGTGAIRNG